MEDVSSKLFSKPGYIPLKEYVRDIDYAKKYGLWKLPLGTGDRLHFLFLRIIARFSWFSDSLFIVNKYEWSPSYAVLLTYLKTKGFFDKVHEKSLRHEGYYSYFFEKKIRVNDRVSTMTGQGISKDRATALSKATGEMLERMISGLGDMNKNITVESPNKLAKNCQVIYPPRHHRFLDIQKKKYQELQHDSTSPIEWVKGVNLITKEKTYIPKQMTSWFVSARNGLEEKLIHQTSNGSAGYFSKSGATLRGLLEVIHRDAFLVHWLTMTAPRIIIQESLPEDIQKFIREFESLGITVYILDVMSIPVPSVYIVAISNQAVIPQVVLSGSSALTYEKAIYEALQEMVMVSTPFHMPHSTQGYDDLYKSEPFISEISKHTRQQYWRGVDKIEQFQWFISGDSVLYSEICSNDITSNNSDFQNLQNCLMKIMKMGEDYFPCVYYPKNKIQKKLGYYIAQVYIPKAFPLYLIEKYGTFDSDRLQEFAGTKNKKNWKLNPLPHGFS